MMTTDQAVKQSDQQGQTGRPASCPMDNPLTALQIVLGQMHGATSLNDLLEQCTATLHQLMGNSVTGVLQLLPNGDLLYGRTIQCDQPYRASRIISVGVGLIGAAARTEQTIASQDTLSDPRYMPIEGWDTRSELCVPIITRHGLWGILDQQSTIVNAYPHEVIQVTEIIAQQLALAVENTALIDRARDQAKMLERRTRELTQILRLNSELRLGMDMDTLLQHLADTVRTVMGFQHVVVHLIDISNDRIWMATHSGIEEGMHQLLNGTIYSWSTFLGPDPERFRISHSYFIPAEAKQATENTFTHADVGERTNGEWHPDDLLFIPIINHRNEVLGMLSVDHPTDRQRPSMATIQGLEILAGQAAAAIENVRLFAQMQETLDALREAHTRQAQLFEEVQRTQAELITASKLAAVGTLAAGVAHEFNNLLAGIYGYAELGLLGMLESKDEALDTICKTCQRGVQITRRLLTFASQTESQRTPAQIDEIAEGALQLISWDLNKSGVSVRRDYQSKVSAFVDPGQIMQVVLNLLTNARDAMYPNGGTITISTRETDEWIELSVADTGCGIPEELRSRIFEPFVTTKGALGGSEVAGSGLGLAVSYGIIQAHEGRLLVESEVGQGSCLTICLPHYQFDLPEPEAPLPLPNLIPMRILVVDDEPQVRAVISNILKREGHSVVQVASALEALARCRHEPWDLIISDVTMPSLDGPGLIEHLRNVGIQIPVLLITGRVDNAGRERALSSRAAALLAKPFDRAMLLKAIAGIFHQRTA